MDECLKSEQATNPEAGKEGSALNLGITMIPVCVCSLVNTQTETEAIKHFQRQTRPIANHAFFALRCITLVQVCSCKNFGKIPAKSVYTI